MTKKKITFDQLTVLSFLKFTKIDGIDMTLLKKGMSDIIDVEISYETDNYFIMSDGTIILDPKYIDKFYKNLDSELFESILGSAAYKYLENINMLEFVLRKIKLLGIGCVPSDTLSDNFSPIQVRFMDLLYKEKYIMEYLHKDPLYENYQAIKLTKRGELYLFMIDYKKEIDNFSELLRINGYNEILIKAFLIAQDLEDNVKNILTLENFINFCDNFDINPIVDNSQRVGYTRVKMPIK